MAAVNASSRATGLLAALAALVGSFAGCGGTECINDDLSVYAEFQVQESCGSTDQVLEEWRCSCGGEHVTARTSSTNLSEWQENREEFYNVRIDSEGYALNVRDCALVCEFDISGVTYVGRAAIPACGDSVDNLIFFPVNVSCP